MISGLKVAITLTRQNNKKIHIGVRFVDLNGVLYVYLVIVLIGLKLAI